MNKELADKVLAAARTVLCDRCQIMLTLAYAGNDAVWVVLVCDPQRTEHDGWLSTWSDASLEGLLANVEAFHNNLIAFHAAKQNRPSNWMAELTDRYGRG